MIKSINYNWFATPENGEAFTNRTVGIIYGNLKCDKIEEHQAAGEGDKWYYDIHYSDGTINRVFNPNEIFFNTEILIKMETSKRLWIASKYKIKGYSQEEMRDGDECYELTGEEGKKIKDEIAEYMKEMGDIGIVEFYEKYKEFNLY